MTDSNTESQSSNIGVRIAQLVIALGIVGGVVYFFMRPNAASLAREARLAFRQGDYETANQRAAKAYALEPNADLIKIGAESCQRLDDVDGAIGWYRKATAEDSETYLTAVTTLGSLCYESGRLTEAHDALQAALKMQPDNPALNRAFAQLLNAQGRRWESTQYYTRAIRNGALGNEVLMSDALLIANHEALFEDTAMCEKAIARVPDDPIGELGLVGIRFRENKHEEGLAALERILRSYPDLLEAHSLVARGLIESDQLDKMPDWNANLPANAETFPSIWIRRGSWAEKTGQLKAAARCYWESLRLEPNSITANQRLGLTLTALGQKDDAQPFVDRQGKLSDFNKVTHPIYLEGPNIEFVSRAADLAKELGRPWEELTWLGVMLQFGPQLGAPEDVISGARTFYQSLKADLQRTMPPQTYDHLNPTTLVDLSDYPLPEWSSSSVTTSTQPPTPSAAVSEIRFEDVASNVGLNFGYFNSADDSTKGFRMIETGGGGVAALDFDLDGWPDIHFTQGCVWPFDPNNEQHTDKLFRSISGERFEDVTDLAGSTDFLFGQGVSISDVDSDGFPDVYLGNIGRNRLLHNNGDGTFTEVTIGVELPSRWTTSVLAADLNGDGHPDLFDVNYLAGEEIYTRLCGAEVQRSCGPGAFGGEQDDIFLSNGDGTFREASAECGIADAKGKGLGIIAADFDGSGMLNVFVANDGIENYYWVPNKSATTVRFTDKAYECGVAFDSDSRGQACMGVAVDDYDGNGALDIFITNFTDDSNTLYSMTADTLFEDKAREAGLRVPSFDFLGFGTQFIDADLDGRPDLVLTNGHVDDFSAGDNYRMRPQFFRNVGGRFVEVMPASDARYANKKQLGRGLARIDFNRDGKQDFVVSHLETPAALARNETPGTGHFVTLRLVGTRSSRDAIGAKIVVEAGDLRRTTQLIGGSGYQAENERTLNIGLGDESKVDRLTIRWLSGSEQVLTAIEANAEYIIIEGSTAPLEVPR